MPLFRTLFFLLFLPVLLHAASIPYMVDFEGIDDGPTLRSIKSVSGLVSLKKRPPASINALRYRAESDLPDILKVLHAHGYFEAQVTFRIEEGFDRIHVVVQISLGPIYTLEEYSIVLYSETPDQPTECDQVQLKELGIELGKPVFAQKVLDSEQRLLTLLGECGYPLAEIENREIIADGETKTIRIKLDIKTGAISRFGNLGIEGAESVSPELIDKKLAWQQGEIYDSALVEKTQKNLMDTGLFSSLLITHDETLTEDKRLPMKLEIVESKHRSINVGASYQTVYGFGATFGWEHRNIQGLGRKLSLKGDITTRSHSGAATFLVPDFRKVGQDFVLQALAMHESLFAYSQRSYSGTARFETKIGERMRFSAGAELERIFVTKSAQNGNFLLFEVPLYYRWSNANSLLNPTKGYTFEYRAKPSVNFTKVSQYYLVQEATQSFHKSLNETETIVLAQKLTLGSILSTSLSAIPLSKRFLGGSEDELRGYRFRTVSPLNSSNEPLGGRSAIYYSLELRFRVTETMGLVPFFDIGNVNENQLPLPKGKWFKATGLGYRYFSFMGPFRIDVGFPLDRRRGIDPLYRVLVSIGQMF